MALELGPPLRNLTVLPLLLSQERDETLLQLTEGRIPVFAHDMVPDYLRTKPEPTAEARMLQHEQKVKNCVQCSGWHSIAVEKKTNLVFLFFISRQTICSLRPQ